jgi:hypothetical protein
MPAVLGVAKRLALVGYSGSVAYGYVGLIAGGGDPFFSLPLALVVGPLELASQLSRAKSK